MRVAFTTSSGGCLTVYLSGATPEWINQRGAQLSTVEKRTDGSVRLLINSPGPGIPAVRGSRDAKGCLMLQFTRECEQRNVLVREVGFFGVTEVRQLQTVGDSLEIIVPADRRPLILRGSAKPKVEAEPKPPAAAANGNGGLRVRITDVKAAVANVNELAAKYGSQLQLRIEDGRLHAGVWQDIH